MRIIDVRGSDGQLCVLGGSLVLPTSATAVTAPLNGSIRWNNDTQALEYYGGESWAILSPTTQPYDMYGTYLGQPPNQTLWRVVLPRQVTFPAGLTGSVAVCATAPTASTLTLSISKNGSSIGTINYVSSSTIGGFTFASQIVFNSGDIMEVDGPSSDATFTTPSWAIVGSRAT